MSWWFAWSQQNWKQKNKRAPSILSFSNKELKPLPSYIKYAFLGKNESLYFVLKMPTIISSCLPMEQEHALLEVLSSSKSVIAWNIDDIKWISPKTCEHRIFIEENAKPSKEPQKWQNPHMFDV